MISTSDGRDPTEPEHAMQGSSLHDAADVSNRLHFFARLWPLLAGICAGLSAFGLGEACYELVRPENGRFNTMGTIVIGPYAQSLDIAETQNGAVAFGLLGGCLGAFLGITGGLTSRSVSKTLAAAVLGVVLGAGLGVGISLAVIPLALKLLPGYPRYEVIISAVMHGSIWGVSGAVAGLAFAAGLGQPRRFVPLVLAGFTGAVLGTVMFELVGSIIFPLANTGRPISSTWPSRLAARLLVTLATSGALALSVNGPRPHRASTR
jgi:hypothetical protein